jgi:hypothetical protein
MAVSETDVDVITGKREAGLSAGSQAASAGTIKLAM